MKPVSEFQRGLQYFNGHLFIPDGATAGGRGLGAAWTTGGGTLSHATPGTAFDTQLKRTVYTQVVTTANQELGPRQSAASEYQYWLGNARWCGGLYLSTVFRIEAWAGTGAGTDGRLFIGFTAGANPNVISDTLQNNSMGLFHKSTDGPNVLNFVTRNNAGTETTGVITDATHGLTGAGGVVLAAGNTFLFEIWHMPNGIDSPPASAMNAITVNAKLSIFDTSTMSGGSTVDGYALNRVKKLGWNEVGFASPRPTATMFAPQVQMSNGPSDATAGHYSIGVANVYVAPWSGEMD